MMAFAQLSDVENRLEWDLDDAELRVAQAALEDLTVDAIDLGQAWTEDNVPRIVRKAVLAAAVRYMRNLEGVVQSRAGDETLIYNEIVEGAGSPQFTRDEVNRIVGSALGVGGFGTVEVVAWGATPRAHSGYVPDEGSPEPILFFAEDDDS